MPRCVNMQLYEPTGGERRPSKCRKVLMYQRISAFVRLFQTPTNNPGFRRSYAQSHIRMFYEPPSAHFVYLLCFAYPTKEEKRSASIKYDRLVKPCSFVSQGLQVQELNQEDYSTLWERIEKARTTLKDP